MIVETLRLQQQVAAAAADWKRTRVKVALATTFGCDGLTVAAAMREHDAAIDRLAAAVDALAEHEAPPPLPSEARTEALEQRIVYQSITWLGARAALDDDGKTYAHQLAVDEATDDLYHRVADLVSELTGVRP
ncbi:MAG: hypothetical protein ACJ76I_11970 [Gaiellaceae bacterium]